MKLSTLLKNYYKTIIWIFLMLYLLFSPSNVLPKGGFFNIPHFDKLVHFGMFAFLIFLFRQESEKNAPEKLILRNLFLFLTLIFAALSEVIQYKYIFGRSGNVYDFLADLLGFAVGTLFYILIWKKLSARFLFLQKL